MDVCTRVYMTISLVKITFSLQRLQGLLSFSQGMHTVSINFTVNESTAQTDREENQKTSYIFTQAVFMMLVNSAAGVEDKTDQPFKTNFPTPFVFK